MNKNSKWILKINELLMFFMAIIGFNSCSSENNEPLMEEYGTPTVKFSMDGVITGENGNSIAKLKVRLNGIYNQNFKEKLDSTYTDDNGKYKFNNVIGFPTYNVILDVEDVDGDKNGNYTNMSTPVTYSESDIIESGSGWFRGSYYKKVNITIKSK